MERFFDIVWINFFFFQSDHHRPSTPGSWKKPPMRAQSTSQLHLTPFPSSYSGFPARVPVQTLVFQPPPYSALVELRSPRTSYYDVASPVSCSCQAVSPVSRKSAPLLSAVSKCSQDSEHDNGSPCYKEAPPLPKCTPPPLIFGQPLLVIPRQKTPHEKERGGSGRVSIKRALKDKNEKDAINLNSGLKVRQVKQITQKCATQKKPKYLKEERQHRV